MVQRAHAAELVAGADTVAQGQRRGGGVEGSGSKQSGQKLCSNTFMYALHVLSRF